MAEVLSPTPPPPTMAMGASSPTTDTAPRVQARSRLSTSTRSAHRLSTLSKRTSRSRTPSALFPAYPSTLPYAIVRDFAYAVANQLHYGPSPEGPSGTTTPASERRLSDPMDAWNASRGPWGGDGIMYTDPVDDDDDDDNDGEALPATSFSDEMEDDGSAPRGSRRGKHRKSKSYTDFTELERGRNNSNSQRRSHMGDTSARLDPAGQDGLRQSRSYGRRDPHMSATLPSRSFHTSQVPAPDADEDLLPLDAEQSAHAQSPQRASMGPEDELYAGESLALYSFEPENPNELRLREGQIILVSYKHGQGWLVAEDPETGEQGLVPEEYVRLVREIESWDPERGGFIDEDSMVLDESGGPIHRRLRNSRAPVATERPPDEANIDVPAAQIATELVESPGKCEISNDRSDSAHGQP